MELIDITLHSPEPETISAFYADRLGLEKTGPAEFRIGTTKLRFLPTDEYTPLYHFAFNIPTNQLFDAMRWVEARTPVMKLPDGSLIADFASWNAHAFYFKDSDGNILECIARHDLNNISGSPFSGQNLLNISELGIAVPKVPEFVEKMEKSGLSAFARQTPRSDFAAMGDDNGLFIVVPEGRNWYPGKQAAVASWSKTIYRINGEEKTLETKGG